MNMREREQLSGREYEVLEQHVEEAEKHDSEDQLLKSRIQAEVEASIAKPGGRQKAEDGWEVVLKPFVDPYESRSAQESCTTGCGFVPT